MSACIIDVALALTSMGSNLAGTERCCDESPPVGCAVELRRTPSSIREKENETKYLSCKERGTFVDMTFPEKLMHILSDSNGWTDIIMWLPQGHAFIVKDQKILTLQVLPLCLGKYISYAGFKRRLARWKFNTVAKNTFSCEHFHRDRPQLCSLMTCDGNECAAYESDKNSDRLQKHLSMKGKEGHDSNSRSLSFEICSMPNKLQRINAHNATNSGGTLNNFPGVSDAQELAMYYARRRNLTRLIVQQAFVQLQLEDEIFRSLPRTKGAVTG